MKLEIMATDNDNEGDLRGSSVHGNDNTVADSREDWMTMLTGTSVGNNDEVVEVFYR